MDELKIPTIGRDVHFFPKNDRDKTIIGYNGVHIAPAKVIQVLDTSINLQVFTMNPDVLNVLRYCVPHKSIAYEGQSYWDWLEIK